MKKVSLIIGSQPEAIKLCPLVLTLKEHADFEPHICLTGRHRQMLDQVPEWESTEAPKIRDIKPMRFFHLKIKSSTAGLHGDMIDLQCV